MPRVPTPASEGDRRGRGPRGGPRGSAPARRQEPPEDPASAAERLFDNVFTRGAARRAAAANATDAPAAPGAGNAGTATDAKRRATEPKEGAELEVQLVRSYPGDFAWAQMLLWHQQQGDPCVKLEKEERGVLLLPDVACAYEGHGTYGLEVSFWPGRGGGGRRRV